MKTFSGCITDGFPNFYLIADELSKTSPEQYIEFCNNANLDCERVAIGDIPLEVRKCSLAVKAHEVVYDHDLLRDQIKKAFLDRPNLQVKCGLGVDDISRREGGYRLVLSSGEVIECDAVVNSAYANINRFDAMLNLPVTNRQYEYTVVPVVETDFERLGIAIMDGPFPTIMPYGKKDLSLLYHVELSVIATGVTDQMDQNWLKPETSPFRDMDRQALFERIKESCAAFIPAIAETRLVGFLEGPRMVMADHDEDDARPSLINKNNGDRYITIFSGKVDHSLRVAGDVTSILCQAVQA